jgi:hypothetical protein
MKSGSQSGDESAYLIRHQGIDGDKVTAREAGIFDTLGYHEYADQDDLVRRLTSNIDPEPLSFSLELDHRAPMYLVEPPVKGLAVTAMISRLKKARYRYAASSPVRMFDCLPPMPFDK